MGIEQTIRNAICAAVIQRYHKKHHRQANRILNSIESERGPTDISLIKKADQYATEILGWKGYAPWLYVSSAVNGRFKEGWIPDNYYGRIVVPLTKGDYGNISDYNALASRLFKEHNAFESIVPDIAYYANGLFLSKSLDIIPASKLINHLFSDTDRVVFKKDNSLQGKGIYIYNKLDLSPDAITKLGNGVFQKYIKQHDLLSEISPTSVATLRITTVMENTGAATVRSSYLKIGRSADSHIKQGYSIRIPVNLSNGELNAKAFLPSWCTTEHHPDTGVKFGDIHIPLFSECLKTVLQLHKHVPFARCIGWDITVDHHDSIKLIEWNGSHNDIKFSEATQGPCFTGMEWENLWKMPYSPKISVR